MRVLQYKVQARCYRTEYLNYSWSASLWNTICPSCQSVHETHSKWKQHGKSGEGKKQNKNPITVDHQERVRGQEGKGHLGFFDEGEKRKGRCCDEQTMKSRQANKQTQAQCESLVFQRLKVPARSGATAAPASPSSLWASDPSSDARSAPQFVSGEYNKINTCTPKSRLQASMPAVSFSSRLFVSLFPPIMFALCFSSPLFFLSLFVSLYYLCFTLSFLPSTFFFPSLS